VVSLYLEEKGIDPVILSVFSSHLFLFVRLCFGSLPIVSRNYLASALNTKVCFTMEPLESVLVEIVSSACGGLDGG
jgi:hypothetical protein